MRRARGCEAFHTYRAAQALPDLEAQVPQKVWYPAARWAGAGWA